MKTPIPAGTMAGFVVAALACVLASNSASAQTTYNATLDNEVELIYGAIFPNTSPHYDAINFATGNGTKLNVDQDVSFNGSALANVFTSTTFTSTGGRVSASMLGIDEFFTPVDGRTFIVQNFTLDNVDFTTSNSTTGDVGLRIQGPGGLNTSLTLVNSSLNCSLAPHFYVPSALTFNVSGTSQITGWGHDPTVGVASTTTLTVASGGAFTIKDSGSLTSGATYQQRLFFNQYSNTATLNGSSLIIDNSAVVFGANPYGDPSKESTMTFSNNATLQITGLNPYASLETDNLVFQNSTLNVATNNSRLKLRNNLELDNSSATIANYAQADTFGIIAKGNATVSLGVNGLFNTSKVDIRDGARMTITGSGYDIGEMTVSSQVLFPSSGTGNLVLGNSKAVLNLTSGATMDVTSHAALTNNGSINLQEAKMTVRQGASVTNNLELIVMGNSTLSITGDAIVGQDSGQHGVMTIGGNITFIDSSTPGNNSLTTTNQLDLGSTSNLHMTLDPTGLTSDRILIDNSAREFTINNSATLSLNVVNDTALVIGTKFLLINYPDWQVAMGAHFNGLVDGATFALGLNTYQINYNDGDYIPAQGSTFITLTTVPEPGTLALLGLGAIALAGRALRRR
ncbi:MAG: PEP-CTERM sorting domain-containing protein [Verrucomicrobia bacterium]|nr:PEP-CTERM sorting domain-containing protein [Verrucomicrobiota bacterium]